MRFSLSLVSGFLVTLYPLLVIMPSAAPEPDFEALDSLTEGSNKFAIALYQALTKSGENVIVSPVSLQLVLALAHSGAKGTTANEIATVLGFPSNTDLILRGHKSLIELLQLPVLSLANKIFVEKTLSVVPGFQSVATKYFLSGAEGVSFKTDHEGARKNINTWVENQTKNKIKELIPSGLVDSETRLVLTNAIHFKANWAKKFPQHATSDQPFYLTPTQTVNVKMMYLKSKFGYRHHEDLNAHLVEIPYEGKEMRMILIVPTELDGLKEVEKKLTNINLAEEFSKLSEVTIELSLPKFKVEKTMELNEILKGMGLGTMYSDGADFSGISETEPLKVSHVIQKAFIEVNEEGTEAAAATAMNIVPLSALIEDDPAVLADRPFIYFIIKDSKTLFPFVKFKSVVFIGKINNPN